MDTRSGTALSVSRRYVFLRDSGQIITATVRGKLHDITVGDHVRYSESGPNQWTVEERDERRNELVRSYGSKAKRIASNLDLVCVITAPGALYQPPSIDRFLVAATLAHIPALLVVNKAELAPTEVEAIQTLYQRAGIPTLAISAKSGSGLDKLLEYIADKDARQVAFAGVSGVGKSTLLNALAPDARREIGALSQKGQSGRQTTTQAFGWEVAPENSVPFIAIDLPGIQNYGLTHLDADELCFGFPEFQREDHRCPFDNCSHIAEQKCVVKEAVQSGEIAQSRYDSYVNIREEVRAHNRY